MLDPAIVFGSITAVATAAATGIGAVWTHLRGQLAHCEAKHEECEGRADQMQAEITTLSVRLGVIEGREQGRADREHGGGIHVQSQA